MHSNNDKTTQCSIVKAASARRRALYFPVFLLEPMAATQYNWTEPYQAALFELNPEKISDQITRAEDVIQKRRMELLQASEVGDEFNAIEQALKALVS